MLILSHPFVLVIMQITQLRTRVKHNTRAQKVACFADSARLLSAVEGPNKNGC